MTADQVAKLRLTVGEAGERSAESREALGRASITVEELGPATGLGTLVGGYIGLIIAVVDAALGG